MLLLFETACGFALFNVLKDVTQIADLSDEFSTAASAQEIVTLVAFQTFTSANEASEAATSILQQRTPGSALCKFLESHCDDATLLGVYDSTLGQIIKNVLNINCVHNKTVEELLRGIRSHMDQLIPQLDGAVLAPVTRGLAHCLAQLTLNSDPEKADIMILHAIRELDHLDKCLSTYHSTLRNWYGYHFPELANIIPSNSVLYAMTVRLLGNRTNAANLDFSQILDDEVALKIQEAAVGSLGDEVDELDLLLIRGLCVEVLATAEYRTDLCDYLKKTMMAIAPRLTGVVGELVGARLIAIAGGVKNLAKKPASTVQLLGAEKALFRALTNEVDTPKYGVIYHAPCLVDEEPRRKARRCRTLAAKASRAIRIDVFRSDG